MFSLVKTPDQPPSIPPEKLPDPWLADSTWLLQELAKARETILRIPLHLNSTSDIKSAVDRIWGLEQQIRYLLGLQAAMQRSFVQKAEALSEASEPPKAGLRVVRAIKA
jgi:hypothetical protein